MKLNLIIFSIFTLVLSWCSQNIISKNTDFWSGEMQDELIEELEEFKTQSRLTADEENNEKPESEPAPDINRSWLSQREMVAELKERWIDIQRWDEKKVVLVLLESIEWDSEPIFEFNGEWFDKLVYVWIQDRRDLPTLKMDINKQELQKLADKVSANEALNDTVTWMLQDTVVNPTKILVYKDRIEARWGSKTSSRRINKDLSTHTLGAKATFWTQSIDDEWVEGDYIYNTAGPEAEESWNNTNKGWGQDAWAAHDVIEKDFQNYLDKINDSLEECWSDWWEREETWRSDPWKWKTSGTVSDKKSGLGSDDICMMCKQWWRDLTMDELPKHIEEEYSIVSSMLPLQSDSGAWSHLDMAPGDINISNDDLVALFSKIQYIQDLKNRVKDAGLTNASLDVSWQESYSSLPMKIIDWVKDWIQNMIPKAHAQTSCSQWASCESSSECWRWACQWYVYEGGCVQSISAEPFNCSTATNDEDCFMLHWNYCTRYEPAAIGTCDCTTTDTEYNNYECEERPTWMSNPLEIQDMCWEITDDTDTELYWACVNLWLEINAVHSELWGTNAWVNFTTTDQIAFINWFTRWSSAQFNKEVKWEVWCFWFKKELFYWRAYAEIAMWLWLRIPFIAEAKLTPKTTIVDQSWGNWNPDITVNARVIPYDMGPAHYESAGLDSNQVFDWQEFVFELSVLGWGIVRIWWKVILQAHCDFMKFIFAALWVKVNVDPASQWWSLGASATAAGTSASTNNNSDDDSSFVLKWSDLCTASWVLWPAFMQIINGLISWEWVWDLGDAVSSAVGAIDLEEELANQVIWILWLTNVVNWVVSGINSTEALAANLQSARWSINCDPTWEDEIAWTEDDIECDAIDKKLFQLWTYTNYLNQLENTGNAFDSWSQQIWQPIPESTWPSSPPPVPKWAMDFSKNINMAFGNTSSLFNIESPWIPKAWIPVPIWPFNLKFYVKAMVDLLFTLNEIIPTISCTWIQWPCSDPRAWFSWWEWNNVLEFTWQWLSCYNGDVTQQTPTGVFVIPYGFTYSDFVAKTLLEVVGRAAFKASAAFSIWNLVNASVDVETPYYDIFTLEFPTDFSPHGWTNSSLSVNWLMYLKWNE